MELERTEWADGDGQPTEYTPLPSRARIRLEVRAFQREINEAIAAGKNAHQFAVAAADALFAFAGTMRAQDRVIYLTTVCEEQNALIHASESVHANHVTPRRGVAIAASLLQDATQHRAVFAAVFVGSMLVTWIVAKALGA